MTPSSDSPQPLVELVSYLFTRREAILNNWRQACEQDEVLNRISSLSREEFNNLLPVILNILEQRLLNKPQEADPGTTATSHGLHRWQKAYALPETLRELNLLTQILFAEIQSFQEIFPKTDTRLLLQAQQTMVQLMTETIEGSVQKYDEFQRLEAANRFSTLQQALDQIQSLSRQRGDLLRTSSHDLKSSFGIINSAASVLRMEGLSDQEREQFMDMLNRNLTHVQSMLGSLMDLSRLEAGEESLHIQSFDAAKLLKELVTGVQPMAAERGLVLRADGPDSLPVESDPVKIQRIVQNLLLNAIQYTPTGFISVSWSNEVDMHWMFSIQDSGPGLQSSLTSLLAKQLRPTIDSTSSMGPGESQPVPVLPSSDHEITGEALLQEQTNGLIHGEGVGLQIVKRLCELLKANLDIETRADRGTLFRIRLPSH
ncbi:HAMP domain-containing histidine kinase [Spirosoma sp. KCTC 42546]|uniref:sensor histidine kinase n=1 Tax=Spirosoma sp. KCTC 42546 TaxID=2520506 RepID=UPI001158464F|nr:HAMP domain-containing sensor histidine kinase [Spirosoma sp. KCTC 42546]QDK78642.1 HAMP domain-containing histidine kinase [Spirosoma sp. KCTC 42546]